MTQAGAWLFRQRGWLPVPLLVLMLLPAPSHWLPGLGIVGLGEALRLMAVGYIGLPSRTRGSDVGVLVRAGPYGWLRNPLYVGNVLIFAGFGVVAWPMALVAVPLLALHYGLIVRWEEANLLDRLGVPYARYHAEVPRWFPRRPPAPDPATWSPRVALRSERSTLLAIVVIVGGLLVRGTIA